MMRSRHWRPLSGSEALPGEHFGFASLRLFLLARLRRAAAKPDKMLATFATGLALIATADAQTPRIPTARLISAPEIRLPADIDSNNPGVWSMRGGIDRLFVISSWGGVPVRASGTTLERLRVDGPVSFTSHPGHGVWMEAIVPDAAGTWYGYYHHERPADFCGRPDRQLPRVGAMRSFDEGLTWEELGIVLDAPPESEACDSNNRFVLGGVGDVTAALDRNGNDLYLYFSQYVRDGASQGVAVARMAWADRDAPAGKAAIWNNGGWLPATRASNGWSYPIGTPLVRSQKPFHGPATDRDVFWGASIHWNTYLNQYVMLLNRAENDVFGQEGVYVSFAATVADPTGWSVPVKIHDGGEWYPQVIGEEFGRGTDRLAGRMARFFMFGRSKHFIHFSR